MEPADEQRPSWTGEEMLIVAASRLVRDRATCFAGIGLPSTAAILAQATHAPNVYLVYESGTLGPRPARLPLSVADGVLARTAETIVSLPEMFNYWLQPGRFDLGMLGAAQVDRFANINSTVIGDYTHPRVRLPGAGGAPEIAAACKETLLLVRQTLRTFVERVDFVSAVGHGSGAGARQQLGFTGAGPVAVITDIGVYEPDPTTRELTLTRLHVGRTVVEAQAAAAWEILVSAHLTMTPAPTGPELKALRALTSIMT